VCERERVRGGRNKEEEIEIDEEIK